MPILLQDLISQLPSDTEEKVRKARDRFNTRIRDALRRETRLTFRREDGSNASVPIHVVAGLPEPLTPMENQSIDDRYRVALLLAPFRQTLGLLRDSGKTAEEALLPILAADRAGRVLLDHREEHLRPTWEYADFLLRKLTEFELTRFILRVNSDVLGVYRYKVRSSAFDEPEPKIELYWGIIGLIARDLAVSVEDLTVVILAHELAHAYTHIGLDADDHWWPTRNFAESAHELVEGLAQFYTRLACERVDDAGSGPLQAFLTLLPHQPNAYRTHERWKDSSSEHVRLAMLEIRRTGMAVKLAPFESCLEGARRQLRRVKPEPSI